MPHQTHPDWEAFLAAVVADPDDDTVRLVAADWLDDHDDPDRAAFIRIQVELAAHGRAGEHPLPRVGELLVKERAFLGPRSHFPGLWGATDCPELVRVKPSSGRGSLALEVAGGDRVRFHRGFVEEVAVPAAVWVQHGAAVRGRNPIRRVLLSRCDHITRDHWYQMMESGALSGLDELLLDTDDGGTVDWLRGFLPGTDVNTA